MLQPLDSARPKTNQLGRLEYACTLGELASSGFKLPWVSVGAPEALTP